VKLRLPRGRRTRVALGVAAGLFAALAVFLAVQWKRASDNGGQRYAEPFRIAENLYYVGANDVASFLLTGPDGHVLIDGGYPGTAAMIQASVEELGFDIRDVRILLNTHYHLDHAGGLASLQEASGAELWVSEGDADAVASGGDDPDLGVLRLLVWSGLARYPRPRVDHRFGDGDTVRLGPIELVGHVTPGHTRGCTQWTFLVRDGDRELLASVVCGVGVPPRTPFFGATRQEMEAAYERTFQTMRSLPVDIFLAPHARVFGRWRKFQASQEEEDPVAPFIDPEGYQDFVDDLERQLRRTLTDGDGGS
jgi:metallo-beta-lactamase class B